MTEEFQENHTAEDEHEHRHARRIAWGRWFFAAIALFYLLMEHQAHLLMVGFLLQWPTLITMTLFPILVMTYIRLARREEQQALDTLGETYRDYMGKTPGWWPKRT